MAEKRYDTFSDGLGRLLRTLTDLKMLPDADMDLLNGVEGTLLAYVKGTDQGQALGGALGGAPVPVTAPSPLPVVPGEQSRGPATSPDMGGAIEELSRVMAGS